MPKRPSSDSTNQRELHDLLDRMGPESRPGAADWDRLFELVYGEFRGLADRILYSGRAGRTITPTVLVHETFLHLSNSKPIDWSGRAHFFGTAARAMRQVLAHHAERARAQKRGGDWQRVTLVTSIQQEERAFDAVELDDLLTKLADEHERMAQVCEFKLYAGMSSREIAEVLGVSRRTVDTDWSLARKWLSRELGNHG